MTCMVWFTSDTHFSHPAIIRHQPETRPFNTIEEHDEALIAAWNRLVCPGDLVYHLGDFCWGKTDRWLTLLERLNGGVYLIEGNHDRGKVNTVVRKKLAGYTPLKTVSVNGQPIVLCHYAMAVWDRQHYGAWHLYGHSHGNLPERADTLSTDVGVDRHGLRPVPFEEVEAIMVGRKLGLPGDHHK